MAHFILITIIGNVSSSSSSPIVIMTMIILIIRNGADIYGGTNSCFMAVITNTAATRSLFFRHRCSFSIIIKETFCQPRWSFYFLWPTVLMINNGMVQQWTEHQHKILKYGLNIHKNIHVEILGPYFLSRLPPQLCKRDSCGGRWFLVQVSVSLPPVASRTQECGHCRHSWSHNVTIWTPGGRNVTSSTSVDQKWQNLDTQRANIEGMYDSRGIFMRRNLILFSQKYLILYEIWTVCWRARKNMKLAQNDSRPFFRDVFTWPPGFKSWIFESGIELPFVKIGTHSLSSQGCVIFTCASVWLADVPGLGNVSFISFRRFCLSLVQSTWIASQQKGPEGFCRCDAFVMRLSISENLRPWLELL